MYLLNMKDEVSQLANETSFAARPSKNHCMDYLVNTDSIHLHGHNEDGDCSVPNFAYWLNVTYTDAAPGDSASFFAFTYPGQLSGNAFGFTGTHMAISTNALFPEHIATFADSMPRNFINRATMNAATPHDALRILKSFNPATGFTLHTSRGSTFLSTEVAPSPAAFFTLTPGVGQWPAVVSHFNAYKYLTNITQVHDDSSYHRQARADMLPIAYSSQAIRDVLGDTFDKVQFLSVSS
jgi:hypothetical protein